MQIIDLSHLVNNDTPVYPGTEKPHFEMANTIENDGFAETLIKMYSHTGTHMDAPAHMIDGASTLDSYVPSKFYGTAICIDCTKVSESIISKELLLPFTEILYHIDFVLLVRLFASSSRTLAVKQFAGERCEVKERSAAENAVDGTGR